MCKLAVVLLLSLAIGCGLDPCGAEAQALGAFAPIIGNAVFAASCAAQGAQMARGVDTDGDGIPDSTDDCPSTPVGPAPDPQRPGCPLPTTAPLAFAAPVAAGFTSMAGTSWQSTAGYDTKAGIPTVATLTFSAPVDPALQHALTLQVNAAVDLNSGANITDCPPPGEDYINGHCIKRSLSLQVLASGEVLLDAELTQTTQGWAPSLPTIVLPIGSSRVDTAFTAIGSVLLTPSVLAGQDRAAAVR